METVESLKRRIRTAEDLHSVVRTMKALAAVNIRQLEDAVESLADYSRTIELGLRVVVHQQGRRALTARTARHESLGAIVIGSDQGMCGPLNDQIVAHTLEHLAAESPNPRILAIGTRPAARLADAGGSCEIGRAHV